MSRCSSEPVGTRSASNRNPTQWLACATSEDAGLPLIALARCVVHRLAGPDDERERAPAREVTVDPPDAGRVGARAGRPHRRTVLVEPVQGDELAVPPRQVASLEVVLEGAVTVGAQTQRRVDLDDGGSA